MNVDDEWLVDSPDDSYSPNFQDPTFQQYASIPQYGQELQYIKNKQQQTDHQPQAHFEHDPFNDNYKEVDDFLTQTLNELDIPMDPNAQDKQEQFYNGSNFNPRSHKHKASGTAIFGFLSHNKTLSIPHTGAYNIINDMDQHKREMSRKVVVPTDQIFKDTTQFYQEKTEELPQRFESPKQPILYHNVDDLNKGIKYRNTANGVNSPSVPPEKIKDGSRDFIITNKEPNSYKFPPSPTPTPSDSAPTPAVTHSQTFKYHHNGHQAHHTQHHYREVPPTPIQPHAPITPAKPQKEETVRVSVEYLKKLTSLLKNSKGIDIDDANFIKYDLDNLQPPPPPPPAPTSSSKPMDLPYSQSSSQQAQRPRQGSHAGRVVLSEGLGLYRPPSSNSTLSNQPTPPTANVAQFSEHQERGIYKQQQQSYTQQYQHLQQTPFGYQQQQQIAPSHYQQQIGYQQSPPIMNGTFPPLGQFQSYNAPPPPPPPPHQQQQQGSIGLGLRYEEPAQIPRYSDIPSQQHQQIGPSTHRFQHTQASPVKKPQEEPEQEQFCPKTPSPTLVSQASFPNQDGSPYKKSEYGWTPVVVSANPKPPVVELTPGSARKKAGDKISTLPPGQIDNYVIGPDENKVYTCNFNNCGKTFTRRFNVRSHVQTHLCDRPFVCDAENCGKAFVRHHDLTRHKKTHEEFNHKCECGKKFSRPDALVKHKVRNVCIGGIANPDQGDLDMMYGTGTDKEGAEKEEDDKISHEFKTSPTKSPIKKKVPAPSVKIIDDKVAKKLEFDILKTKTPHEEESSSLSNSPDATSARTSVRSSPLRSEISLRHHDKIERIPELNFNDKIQINNNGVALIQVPIQHDTISDGEILQESQLQNNNSNNVFLQGFDSFGSDPFNGGSSKG